MPGDFHLQGGVFYFKPRIMQSALFYKLIRMEAKRNGRAGFMVSPNNAISLASVI